MISHQEDINENSRLQLVFITLLLGKTWPRVCVTLISLSTNRRLPGFKLLISAFSVRLVKQHHATAPSPNRCAQRVRHKGSTSIRRLLEQTMTQEVSASATSSI